MKHFGPEKPYPIDALDLWINKNMHFMDTQSTCYGNSGSKHMGEYVGTLMLQAAMDGAYFDDEYVDVYLDLNN